ncbi:MAG: hypothetical protein ACON47_04545 [Flavobacteriaceae bacterium]
MRWIYFYGFIAIASCDQERSYLTADAIQLSTPVIKNRSIFIEHNTRLVSSFKNASIELELQHRETGATTKYKTNDPIGLSQKGSYALRAIAAPFLPSEPVVFEILDRGKSVDSIQWNTSPKPTYFKGGSAVLIDGKSAENSFHAAGWVGSKDPFDLSLVFHQSIQVDSIKMSVLRQPSNWILTNAQLKISWKNKAKKEIKKEFMLDPKAKNTNNSRFFITVPIDDKTDAIALEFIPQKLPQEHPGAGTPAWVFMDEIIVY